MLTYVVILIRWYSNLKTAQVWLYQLIKMSDLIFCPVTLTVTHLDSNFLLGNAQGCRGYPIVYCSDGFCELTGFARTEVMKKTCTCRFLHGEETSERVTQQVQKTLEGQREYQAEVRYYRKNGTVHLARISLFVVLIYAYIFYHKTFFHSSSLHSFRKTEL